jgi:predicted PurR-regulated permease PerM
VSEADNRIRRFRRIFLLALVIVISVGFLMMIRGFLAPLLLAAIFSALSQPIHRRLVRWMGGRVGLASITLLVLLLIVIIGPLIAFFGLVAAQAVEVTTAIRPWVEAQIRNPDMGLISRHLELPGFLVPYEAQVYAKAGEVAAMVGQFLLSGLASATRGTASFLFLLLVMLYSMFFFMRDGEAILDRILYYVPLENADERRMVDKFVSVTRATLKGSLVIGIVQGTLAGAAFAVIGITGAAFWGTVMAVLSVIPGVGTAFVWVPAAIWLAATGSVGAAIGLTLWCVVAVGTVDNVLRPSLVGRDTEMSDLLIMLSSLGGLVLFGPLGLVLGPIVAALFVTVWDLYGVAFAEYLPALPGDRVVAVDGADPVAKT